MTAHADSTPMPDRYDPRTLAARAIVIAAIDAALARADELIGLLDTIDADPDLEPDADDEDGNDHEDVRHEEEERFQPLTMKGGGYSEGAF